jgi:MYXO-CTERM domain-containing protein
MSTRLISGLLALTAFLAVTVASAESSAGCANLTVTVTSTADSGTGTLRNAIKQTNACAGTGTINFNIPGTGPHRITLASPLLITGAVNINGYSEPGAVRNTGKDFDALNGSLMIELHGNGETAWGIAMLCPDGETRASTIQGLVINNVTTYGIYNYQCDGVSILGNYIGTDVYGSSEVGPPLQGVHIQNAASTRVGDLSDPGARNLIAGSAFANIAVESSSTDASFRVNNTIIARNFIGTDHTGTRSIVSGEQASGWGIFLSGENVAPLGTDDQNRIFGNLISGHENEGIWLGGNSQRTIVEQNGLGTDRSIASTISALRAGSNPPQPPPMVTGMENLGSNIRIGDTSGRLAAPATNDIPSNRNEIRYNAAYYGALHGIHVESGANQLITANAAFENGGDGISFVQNACPSVPRPADCVASSGELTANRVWDNGELGVDVDPNGNDDPDGWVIDLSGPVNNVYSVTNPAPSFSCRVDFFSSAACDPSGNGEAQSYLGSYSSSSCPATITFSPSTLPLPSGAVVTALYTIRFDLGDGTYGFSYELSECVQNRAPTVRTLIPNRTATEDLAFSYTFPSTTFNDADGDTLTYSATTTTGAALPSWLTFSPASRTFSGTPGNGDVGVVSVRVRATDSSGPASVTDDFNITVSNVNDPPVARADVGITTTEETAVDIDVLANDTDPDTIHGDVLSVQSVGSASHGTVVNNGDDVRYTPATNYFGSDSFTYTVRDSAGATSSASVTVTVTNVNDSPVANADTATVAEDSSVNIDVLANDIDVDGEELAVESLGTPSHGSVVLLGDDTVTYTPVANYFGTDSFQYRVKDPSGATSVATVTITVSARPDAPVAVDDSDEVDEDGTVQTSVLANDFDVDGDSLTVSAFTQPAHGTVVAVGATSLRYTPVANYFGSDSYGYTVRDPSGRTDTGTVTITVNPLPDAPVATNDSVSATEDTALNISPLGNDSDPDGDLLHIEDFSDPAHGSVAFAAGSDQTLRYVPDADYFGPDSFTYLASDPSGRTDTATVTLSVAGTPDAPVAVNDDVSTPEETSVDIRALENDIDVDDESLRIVAVGTPANGTAEIVDFEETQIVRYVPDADFASVDTFTYQIEDPTDRRATGTIRVTVSNSQDPPVAADDTAATDEETLVVIDVLGNDRDSDEDELVVLSVTQSPNGTVVNRSDDVTFTPATNFFGTATFSYTVSDGNGGTDSATVTVTVRNVQDPPIANNDAATVTEDTSVTITVRANDSDPDGDTITVTAVSDPPRGTAAISGSGATVTYTPDANYFGSDSFTYTLSDGRGGSDTATVTVTVTNAPDAPVAIDDAASTPEDTAVDVNVVANDVDVDGNTLRVTSVGVPAHGTASIISVAGVPTTIRYTPTANYNGSDSLTYVVDDGTGRSDTGTLTITVQARPDAPVAVDDSASTNEDAAVNVAVLTNDFDVDGNTLSIVRVSDPAHGSASISGTSVRYVPDANYNGSDTFTYTIDDTTGREATAMVTVSIAPRPDAPVAVDDAAETDEEVAVDVDVLANDGDVDGTALVDVSAVTQPAHGTATIVTIGGREGVRYAPAANYFGSDSFTYTVDDGTGRTDVGTVTITVDGVQDAPVAVDDSAETAEESTVAIDVLANDFDVDGNSLTVTAVTQGSFGAVVNDGDGVRYTPNANFFGADSFTYTVGDGAGGSDTATVAVTVTNTPDDPVAADDAATTNEDQAVVIDVLDNDRDPDLDTLRVFSFSQPAHGAVTSADGSDVTYTPDADFFGTDSFTYIASDISGRTDTATVTVTVTAVQDAPVAVNDAATISEDGSLSIDVLANDRDVDGDTLEVVSVSTPTNGTAQVELDGDVSYEPNADFHGTDSFTYTMRDGRGGNATATVTVTVTPVNDAPRVGEITDVVMNEDETTSVLFTVSDPDDALGDLFVTAASSSQALITDGTLTISPDGSGFALRLAPQANQSGTTTITLRVFDGELTTTRTFTVTVNAVNDPPTISNISNQVTPEDTQTAPITFTIGDVETTPASLTVSGSSSNQAVIRNADITFGGSGANRTVRLRPVAATSGTATITITVSDGAASTSDTFVLTVSNVADAPTISSISDQTTPEDTATGPIAFTIADEDTALADVVVSAASTNQTLLPDANITLGGSGASRTITLTPAPNRFGTTTVSVTASDGTGSGERTFLLTVTAVNDAPTLAGPASLTVTEDGALVLGAGSGNAYSVSDVDAGSDPLRFTASVDHGALTIATTAGLTFVSGDGTADGTITVTGSQSAINAALDGLVYRPDADYAGTDTLELFVDDQGSIGAGGAGTDDLTVAISVSGVNDVPTLSAIADQSTDEDVAITGIAFTIGDTETAAGSLVISAESEDETLLPEGNVRFSGSGTSRTLSITPAADAFGETTVTVTVSDGVDSAEQTFDVTVRPVNDAPTITEIADQSIPEDGQTGALAFTIGDVETAPTGLIVSATSSNEAVVDDDGIDISGVGAERTVRVAAVTDASGEATITVRVFDGELATTEAFLVTVAGDNDAPTITAIAPVTVAEDNPVGPLAFTIDDVESAANTLTVSATSSNLELVAADAFTFAGGGANRQLGFRPNADAFGTATITVTVSDGEATASSAFLLTVTPVNDRPTISAISDATTTEDTTTSAIAFTVGDVETDPGSLLVTASTDSTRLVAEAGIVLGGSGAERTITLVPVANEVGSAEITVRVSDGDESRTTSFTLEVTPVNDLPTISAIDDQTIDEDTDTGELTFTVGDVETTAGALVVTVSAADGTLVATDGLVLGGAGRSRTLIVTPATNASGTTEVTLSVSDGTASVETTFDLDVTPVNDVPVGEPDAFETDQAMPLVAEAPGVLDNDSDVEGDDLTAILVDTAENGTLTLADDGSFSYTPDLTFSGEDTFTYAVSDGDAQSDPVTVTITVIEVDSDDDTIPDVADNCPTTPNTDQANLDEDDLGDVCDDDVDGDGALATVDCNDRNPGVTSELTFYADNDEDDLGDADSSISVCELLPPEGYIANATDNCPEDFNPEQEDLDEDGLGDICDDDIDGDGILDDGDGSGAFDDNPCAEGEFEGCDDNCRLVPNDDQADNDRNGEGDACAFDTDGDGLTNDNDACVEEWGLVENDGCPAALGEEDGSTGCNCRVAAAGDAPGSGVGFFVGLVGLGVLAARRRRTRLG